MATLLIYILFIIAFGLIAFKHIKVGTVFLLVTFLFFTATGCGLISVLLLKNLEFSYMTQAEPVWKKNNAIVILGAGAVTLKKTGNIKPTIFSYSRIHEAARLYLLCKKSNETCKIIISGGDALATGRSEASVYRDEFLALGVKNSEILLEPHSINTYQNAEFTSAILKSQHVDQVVLVTSGIHIKRALLYFRHFGVVAIPAPSDYIAPQLSIIPLGYSFAMTDFALHEYMGIIRYSIYNFLGWNVPAVSPGSL